MTKERLLTTLRDGRARWEAMIDEVGETRMTELGVAGSWSMKDLVAHLTAFQRTWEARIRGELTGVPPTSRDLYGVERLPAGAGTWTLDEQNEAIRAQSDPLALAVVLAKWRETSDLLAEGIAALTAEDLTTSGRFGWAGDQPLAETMAGDTYGHARLHAADVRAWLDRAGA